MYVQPGFFLSLEFGNCVDKKKLEIVLTKKKEFGNSMVKKITSKLKI